MNPHRQTPKPKPQTAQSGFSLTELMVVLVIIGTPTAGKCAGAIGVAKVTAGGN